MKSILLSCCFFLCIGAYSQVENISPQKKKDRSTSLMITGGAVMVTGIIIAQSNDEKNFQKFGLPCFVIGITLYSFGKSKRSSARVSSSLNP